jgi:hypothetical protein
MHWISGKESRCASPAPRNTRNCGNPRRRHVGRAKCHQCAPACPTSGGCFSFTVTALDRFYHTATAYAGTVDFASSGGQAVLPAMSTLSNGAGTFSATLKTVGNQTLTATDTVASSITGASGSITDSGAAATRVTAISPSAGSVGGRSTVGITGSGFTGTTIGVTFCGVSGTTVTRVAGTTVPVVTPAHAPGTVDGAVTVEGVTATL